MTSSGEDVDNSVCSVTVKLAKSAGLPTLTIPETRPICAPLPSAVKLTSAPITLAVSAAALVLLPSSGEAGYKYSIKAVDSGKRTLSRSKVRASIRAERSNSLYWKTKS